MVFDNYYCNTKCYKRYVCKIDVVNKYYRIDKKNISYFLWSLPKPLANKYLLNRLLLLLENYSKFADSKYLINFKNDLKKYNRFLTIKTIDKLLLSKWCTIACANELLKYNCCSLNDSIYIFDLNNEVINASEKYSNTKYWGILYKKQLKKKKLEESDEINNNLSNMFNKLSIKDTIYIEKLLENFSKLKI